METPSDSSQCEARESIFEAEREAVVADREKPEAIAELADWDTTSADGLD